MIHVSSPTLAGRETEYVLDCLARNELSSVGAYVEKFEKAFAELCGATFAVSCCNGTAALHLALLAWGIQQGHDVFVPALTYVATANAVRYCGANPVFVDVLPDTWCMDPDALSDAISQSKAPAAVIPVHLYGVPADMDRILLIAERQGLPVIEDAAQAHGALYHGKMVGSLGNVGVFSFYGNKILTTGEGGMLVTDNPYVVTIARRFRGQGVDPERRYWHTVVGYNYRLTNIQAAIGLAQVEGFTQKKRFDRAGIMLDYQEHLQNFEMQTVTDGACSANWLFTVLVPKGVDRDMVIAQMCAAGVETRPVFPPLPSLPPYKGVVPPVAADIAARGINLPTYDTLTADDFHQVIASFKRAVRSC